MSPSLLFDSGNVRVRGAQWREGLWSHRGMGCWSDEETAKHLVKDKKADYVLVAKDNQPTLREDIEALGLDSCPPSVRPKR